MPFGFATGDGDPASHVFPSGTSLLIFKYRFATNVGFNYPVQDLDFEIAFINSTGCEVINESESAWPTYQA